MMKVTVIDSDSWPFVQRGEDVVDLDYLSHVYVTTLFIRHFDIKKKKGTCIQKIMLCELHGSG